MTAHLHSQSYGKSRVRLSHISRAGMCDEFMEVTTAISLDGDFAAAFTSADNHLVVATDTMKNTVYVLANDHGVPSIEAFGLRLAQHFLDTYPHVTTARVTLEEKPWQRISITGEAHPHSFVATSERYSCEIIAHAHDDPDDFRFNRSASSQNHRLRFFQFSSRSIHDAERNGGSYFCDDDRNQLAVANLALIGRARQNIRAAILKVFAENFSPSVQATLFEMAEAAFAASPLIDEITITMPNQHHLPFNFEPFGKSNSNETSTSPRMSRMDSSAGRCGGEHRKLNRERFSYHHVSAAQ